ncbi:MAG: hypothetical protein WCF09_03710 [Gallionella sp.]
MKTKRPDRAAIAHSLPELETLWKRPPDPKQNPLSGQQGVGDTQTSELPAHNNGELAEVQGGEQ